MRAGGRGPPRASGRNRPKDDAQEAITGQTIQIAGALAILAAFALAQFGVLNQHGRAYLALNLAGAFVLSLAAYFEEQWGFLLLEGVWTLVSAWGLMRFARRRPENA